MDGPLITVIIITYNRAGLLREAIESVLAQTYPHWELIVVDDGSTDDTREVVSSYSGNIRYFHQPNRGPAAAKNHALRYVRGDYVAFLDSDDVWLPDKLARQVAFLEEHPEVGLLGCGCYYMDLEGRIFAAERAPAVVTHEDLQIFSALTSDTSGAVVRRSCLEAAGPYDENLLRCADWDMWIRVSRLCQVRCLAEPLIKYRCHQSQRWNKTRESVWQSRERIIAKNVESAAIRRRAYSYTHLIFAREALQAGQRAAALGLLLRSYARCPLRLSRRISRGRLLLRCALPPAGYRLLEWGWGRLKSWRSAPPAATLAGADDRRAGA